MNGTSDTKVNESIESMPVSSLFRSVNEERVQARVVWCSSELYEHPCTNILHPNEQRVWMSSYNANDEDSYPEIQEFIVQQQGNDDINKLCVIGWNCYGKV